MKNNTKYIIALVFIASVPLVSFAALDGLTGLLQTSLSIINILIKVVFGLGVIYFFYGMGQFILHDAGNEKTRNDGKQKMLWGVIALFVMASIFGIIQFIGTATGITTGVSGQGGSTINCDPNLGTCGGN